MNAAMFWPHNVMPDAISHTGLEGILTTELGALPLARVEENRPRPWLRAALVRPHHPVDFPRHLHPHARRKARVQQQLEPKPNGEKNVTDQHHHAG